MARTPTLLITPIRQNILDLVSLRPHQYCYAYFKLYNRLFAPLTYSQFRAHFRTACTRHELLREFTVNSPTSNSWGPSTLHHLYIIHPGYARHNPSLAHALEAL